jgi:hypothetical protein
MFMEYLKKIIVVASLISMVGACYVEPRGPRYAHRGCGYGWHWDGYLSLPNIVHGDRGLKPRTI